MEGGTVSHDEFAAHEILDRIENVRVILEVLLLSRDDLSLISQKICLNKFHQEISGLTLTLFT